MADAKDMKTPVEVDTQLAAIYNAQSKLERRSALARGTVIACSRAEYFYRGRKRMTNRTFEEAVQILEPLMNEADSDYVRLPSNYSVGDARRAFATIAECDDEIAVLETDAHRLNVLYDGWSRFFLVTSSAGHVHSSMSCSTCRSTTRYGWMPELSGSSEGDAVALLGPALCSVCFPSAPVHMVGGKISKAQAAKHAA